MSSFGKWSQQGVPQKGWTCIGFEDLGEPAAECANVRKSGDPICPPNAAPRLSEYPGLWAASVPVGWKKTTQLLQRGNLTARTWRRDGRGG